MLCCSIGNLKGGDTGGGGNGEHWCWCLALGLPSSVIQGKVGFMSLAAGFCKVGWWLMGVENGESRQCSESESRSQIVVGFQNYANDFVARSAVIEPMVRLSAQLYKNLW